MQPASDVSVALRAFGGDPLRAAPLASFLGFQPIASPQDLLAGALRAGLPYFFGQRPDRFGVRELYRVGSYDAKAGAVGLWVAVLSQWGARSTDRDRPRRRVARALVEQTADARSLVILVPNAAERGHQREAEFVLPRSAAALRKGADSAPVTSIRALVDLDNPTRFHRDLLRDMVLAPGESLLEVSQSWQRKFSVERVTTSFYQEYMKVRDRVADTLLSHNRSHAIIGGMTVDAARAWATRQMGRMLFLWFLQSKRWLGEPGGHGDRDYLVRLWHARDSAPTPEYFRGLLVPLFFQAMATGEVTDPTVKNLLGYLPYLNGGLFRRNRLEDRIDDAGPVSLPDEVFDPEGELSVLGLLSRYRFTTRESTPDDQSVDPDPELLGRVFENLYQGDERKNTGTYYTPREIVHFMCRQALDGYLHSQTGVDQETLDWLRTQVTDKEDDERKLAPEMETALNYNLDSVRVCDPAVGSGAFLLGMMQEMILLRRGVEHARQARDYIHDEGGLISEWKARAIRLSLYGVDLNPEAVEICQLRLWLSMVLDALEPPREPLPNLDFRIVAGDSLVDRMAGITFKESWPEAGQLTLETNEQVRRLEERVTRRREEFDRTQRNARRLKELRDLIAADQREIVRLHLLDALAQAEGEAAAPKATPTVKKRAERRAQQLWEVIDGVNATDFALVQKPFLWPIAFPEVLQAGKADSGFDIVVANPPYVRQERLDASDQDGYRQAFADVYTGTADILVFFYARALQILRPGGWLAFITSNKYMRAAYGEGLRDYLGQQAAIHRVLDFGDLPLFEANGKDVAAYPAVLIGRKEPAANEHSLRVADLTYPIRERLAQDDLKVTPENVRWMLEDLGGLLEQTEVPKYPQVLLRREGWMLEDPALVRLFERLMTQGTPLGEFVKGRMYRGITTGLNDAFVIDQAKRDELITEDPRSAEIIKPWLRGRDIKRWRAQGAELNVIFTRRGIDIDDYPAIKEHLMWWRGKLEPKKSSGDKGPGRKPGFYKWYEIQDSIDYYPEFAQPKVIWKKTSFSPAFLFDVSGSYLGNTLHFIPAVAPWLAAVLNSTIMEFLMVMRINLLRGGYIELTPTRIDSFPVPDLTLPQKEALARLVEIAGRGSLSVDEEIDRIVGQGFSLQSHEITEIRHRLAVRLALGPADADEEGDGNDDDEP